MTVMEASELYTYQFVTDKHVHRYIAMERTFYIKQEHFIQNELWWVTNPGDVRKLDLKSHISGDVMSFTRHDETTFMTNMITHNPGTDKQYSRRINPCFVKVI